MVTSCPSPGEIERAYFSGNAPVRQHAGECAACGREWSEIAALVDAGRAIDIPPQEPARREQIRDALLALPRPAPARPARARWWQVAALPVAAAAAIAIAWWVKTDPAQRATAHRGQVLAHGDARYLISAEQPDEIVRLVDGTITVEVDPLHRGERFRVMVGDAEIEVVGTAFDATADDDRLVAVRVIHGVVDVRLSGAAARRLTAGQSWHRPDRELAVAPVPAPLPPTAPPPAAAPPQAPATAPARIQSRRDAGAPPPAPAPVPAPAGRGEAQQAFDDGWRALRGSQFDDAAAGFERAANAGGDRRLTEDARYWRAVALGRAGKSVGAVEAFELFLARHPDSARAGEASVMLGWLLVDAEELAAAERRFRAALDDHSERVRKSAAEGVDAVQGR